MALSFCFYLTGHWFKTLINFRDQYLYTNYSARISYKLSYRQQAKVQILTLLSSKGQYLALVYFKNLPKNENVRKMSQQQL